MASRIGLSGIRSMASVAKTGAVDGAVHIRVYPRPRNLAESREILQVLEKYGEVVMYKHLKYEPHFPAPNTVLAIYKAASSAQKLISISPFRFKLERKDTGWTYTGLEIMNQADGKPIPEASDSSRLEHERSFDSEEEEKSGDKANIASRDIQEKDSGFQGLGDSNQRGAPSKQIQPSKRPPGQVLPPKGSLTDLSILPSPAKDLQSNPSSTSKKLQKPTGQVKEFQLWVTPSHMNHQAYIERQGYYGEFVLNRKTIMAEDLEGRVPLEGLCDCRLKKEEVPLRVRNNRRAKGLPQPFSIRALWEKRQEVQA